MDIYSFINSKSIESYLRTINYKFSSLEAAWLIYQCRKASVYEKQRVWKKLIDTMPDCEIKERHNCKHWPSLHQFLKSYMELQNKYIELIENDTPNNFEFIYSISYHDPNKGWQEDLNAPKISYMDTFKYAMKTLTGNNYDCIRIDKIWLDNSKIYGVVINRSGVKMDVIPAPFESKEDEELYCNSFDGMYFDFPLPFKKGDIVWNPGKIIGYDKDFSIKKPIIFVKKAIVANADGVSLDNTDMSFSGYVQRDDGSIWASNLDDYMDYEFYIEELTGEKLLLMALSECLNNKMNPLEFASIYHFGLLKANTRRTYNTKGSQ